MEFISITIGNQRITSKQAINYLKVVIQNRLKLRKQLAYIDEKCALTLCAFTRIMPNLGGPIQERRRLLMKVVTSIVLYAAPTWARAIDERTYRIGIKTTYRRSVLMVISALSSVSTNAAKVSSAMMPLILVVHLDRASLNNTKCE